MGAEIEGEKLFWDRRFFKKKNSQMHFQFLKLMIAANAILLKESIRKRAYLSSQSDGEMFQITLDFLCWETQVEIRKNFI